MCCIGGNIFAISEAHGHRISTTVVIFKINLTWTLVKIVGGDKSAWGVMYATSFVRKLVVLRWFAWLYGFDLLTRGD